MTRIVSQQLRNSAEGEDCTVRVAGCRNERPTVVLCHVPGSGMRGWGMKIPDICSVYACQHCHDVIDGRKNGDWDYEDIVRAMCETLVRMVEKGLIIIKGVKP